MTYEVLVFLDHTKTNIPILQHEALVKQTIACKYILNIFPHTQVVASIKLSCMKTMMTKTSTALRASKYLQFSSLKYGQPNKQAKHDCSKEHRCHFLKQDDKGTFVSLTNAGQHKEHDGEIHNGEVIPVCGLFMLVALT